MNDRLKNFPVSIFAVVMGLTGARIAWKRTEIIWNFNAAESSMLSETSTFLAILIAYATKTIKLPKEIQRELKNIPKLLFFPVISVSLILLSVAWWEQSAFLSAVSVMLAVMTFAAMKNKTICVED